MSNNLILDTLSPGRKETTQSLGRGTTLQGTVFIKGEVKFLKVHFFFFLSKDLWGGARAPKCLHPCDHKA